MSQSGVPQPGPSGGAAVPSSGPDAAVARVVLRAYQAWWAAQVQAFATGDQTGAQVRAYSNGQALSQVLVSLQQLHQAQLVMTGAPATDPVVRQLDLRSSPQSAVIEDCVDVTGWHQADAHSGAIEDPPQRLTRYPATVVLRINDSSWKVFEFNREAGRTC
ncbi:hypothetical protein ACIGXM_18525 [Kitasatospora sp. NPDC052896]|uniref:hypothetical protein n=1 Tax=Kitasatospora sp. NPDC052896 TaxID=3364061 RepID=UPI0037C88E70